MTVTSDFARGRDASLAVVTFWLASGAFALGAGEFAAMSLLPYYREGFGVSDAAAGHAVSFYALGVVIGAPLIAALAARWARKTTLIGLMLIVAAGYALSALAPSMAVLNTMRFLAGLPHGAYFGIAILFAADIAGRGNRARAVSHVMLGIAVSNVIGVPMVNTIGQYAGWRTAYAIVGVLACLTAAMIWRTAPYQGPKPGARPMGEFAALGNRQVLLVLAMGAIGFGGAFAVYAYFSAAFLATVEAPEWWISIGLASFGIGTVLGNELAGRVSGGRLLWSAAGFQALLALAGLTYAAAIGTPWAMFASIFVTGMGAGLVVPLQTRLMDVAGDAQTMAAAMNHAAFNAANALGPWLAGLVLAAGAGWRAPGYVGVALSLGGLFVWGIIMATRRTDR